MGIYNSVNMSSHDGGKSSSHKEEENYEEKI